MPHVTFAPLTGFRVREEELLALGMSLPGLAARGKAIADLPALGLLTLAGMLPEHWSCSYRPAAKVDDELVDVILRDRPNLVAISALTASALEAYALADRLRAWKVPTILGGLHVTSCPDEALQHGDAVVVGDGESCWPQVLRDVETGDLQRRYVAHGRFSLADAPTPRFDLLDAYARPRYTLQTQRGCPLACEFCGASRLLGPFREKPARVVDRELAALLAGRDGLSLELADDNTYVSSRRADELASVFAGRGVRYFTECDWRLGERPEVLAKLAASGLVQVLMGIESLSFRYPGMGAKQAELARMLDAVAAIQEQGIAVNGCFIVGAEGETHDSIDRLAQFLLEAPLAEVQVTLQTPFPGTPLHDRLRREGRLLAERDWSHYTLFDVTYRPDTLSVAQLEAGFQRLLATVFARDAAARRAEIRRRVWRSNPAFLPLGNYSTPALSQTECTTEDKEDHREE